MNKKAPGAYHLPLLKSLISG